MTGSTMRRILAALALAASPGAAFADCTCNCSLGQPVGVCSQPYERPPICQRICPLPLNQTISPNSLNATVSTGSAYGAAQPSSGAPGGPPLDAAAASALISGLTNPATSPYGASPVPGANNATGQVGTGQVGTGAVGATGIGAGTLAPQPGWTGATPIFTGR